MNGFTKFMQVVQKQASIELRLKNRVHRLEQQLAAKNRRFKHLVKRYDERQIELFQMIREAKKRPPSLMDKIELWLWKITK